MFYSSEYDQREFERLSNKEDDVQFRQKHSILNKPFDSDAIMNCMNALSKNIYTEDDIKKLIKLRIMHAKSLLHEAFKNEDFFRTFKGECHQDGHSEYWDGRGNCEVRIRDKRPS